MIDGSETHTSFFSLLFAKHEGYLCRLYFSVTEEERPRISLPKGAKPQEESNYALDTMVGAELTFENVLEAINTWFGEHESLFEV